MKKRVLALVLSTAMVASVLTACGGKDNSSNNANNNTTSNNTTGSSTGESNNGGGDNSQPMDYGSGTIKIWVPDLSVETTQTLVDSFFAEHTDMNGYTVTIEPMGEGEAAGNMITDIEAGADIFAFAQDQLARLVAAGAVTTINGDYATFVSTANDEGAVNAAKVGDEYYAFPITSDNGYFLMYDKSVISDPSTLEGIIADCEAANKNFYFDTGSWYQPAFFFGAGCTLTFDTDTEGNFTGINIDYASENGVRALKAITQMASSKIYQDGSDVGKAVNWAAIVTGTWNSTAAKEVLGENYACAKLPTATVDGVTFQLGGFGGYKLMGVKPQAEMGKLVVCMELAKYLSDTDSQLARYNALGWGPSNLTAKQDSAVQADEALQALDEQLQYTIPQGQYPGDYWSQADALGETAVGGNFKNYTDEQFMAELQAFTDKMNELVK